LRSERSERGDSDTKSSLTGEIAVRVLLVTRLFPNAVEPLGSIFNQRQYGALGRQCSVEVLGLIPWFPGVRLFRRWSAAGALSAVPRFERISGLPVHHPRVPYVPLVPVFTPALFAAGLIANLLSRRKHIDVLVGSCAYPEGVACVWLGGLLGIPTALQALGSDLNVIPKMAGPRQILRWTLRRTDRVITVSAPLSARAVELGADPGRTLTIPNGVDSATFHPRDRTACRIALGLPPGGQLIAFVGSLLEAKGIHELHAAFETVARSRSDLRLAIVGSGPLRAVCQSFADRMSGRVIVAGARPPEDVALFLGAADVLTLPSWREGTPNVILEAVASGRRVVASTVGGIPDVITTPALGELVPPRDSGSLAAALTRALDEPCTPAGAAHNLPTWDDSARLLRAALAELVVTYRTGQRHGAVAPEQS
jgi:glycosyltransferase involved in cell wall biosynthesis